MKLLPTLVLLLAGSAFTGETHFASHPPMRPLPEASGRPLPKGHLLYVDAARGIDTQDGSLEKPWKTLQFSIKQLQPGDTLCLRGGTYYEAVNVVATGTAEAPITIRAQAGELAIVDSGRREFFEHPATAWEPFPGGAEDEYQSTGTYETGGAYGNFGDSMVPLHRYINFHDLRSKNELWRPELGDRADVAEGIYCGPGAHRDAETGRMHIRLSHTKLAGLGPNAYSGETDPRKLPLVITGADYAVQIGGSHYVRLQDLVVRGAKIAAVKVEKSGDIELDGVTLYGGMMALRTGGVQGLRIVDSALRGHAAPWHSRATHKYRAQAGYLLDLVGSGFELARCEFTDNHDFMAMTNAADVKFHHNFVDNFNDDGFEPGAKRERGQLLFYQNLVSRCLSPITAHAKKPSPVEAEPGSGCYWFRNVFDLRKGTYRTQPSAPDETGAFLDSPTDIVAHDHGGPIHAVAYVYQNTFLMKEGGFRGYYAFTWGAHTQGTTRRVFNNIFEQMTGEPGNNFTGMTAADDFQSDGNLFWSVARGPLQVAELFQKFRAGPIFAASKQAYPAGLGAKDQYADPLFTGKGLRPAPGSPAIRAGIRLPAEWPDPLRPAPGTPPDIGAVPAAGEVWQVGVRGRLPLFPKEE